MKCQPDSQLFSAIVDARNTELGVLWARFNIHLVVNGGLLIAVLTNGGDLGKGLGLARWMAPAFGLVLGFLWLLSEQIGRDALSHRDSKIAEFEKKFFDEELQSFAVFRDIPATLYRQARISISLIVVFLIAWGFLTFRTICEVVNRAAA